MFLFAILAIILIILVLFMVVAIGIGGAGTIIIFGDVIVCAAIIIAIMKKLISGRRKRK